MQRLLRVLRVHKSWAAKSLGGPGVGVLPNFWPPEAKAKDPGPTLL